MTTKSTKAPVLLLIGMALGWVLSLFSPSGCRPRDGSASDNRDTTRTIAIDTFTIRKPVAEKTVAVDPQVHKFPVYRQGAGSGGLSHCAAKTSSTNDKPDTIMQIYGTGAGGEPRQCTDSVAVEIPITQKHYRDSTYEAWVSGFAQNIDSIKVFPRTETITIKEYKPPNRWHVGITAGYAYTPRGLQPYIGIGISYSLFSWK